MKRAALILVVIALGLVGYWAAAGHSLWTMTEIPVEVTDELFGTTTTEWEEGYRPGLLDLIAPIAGALLLGAGILYFVGSKREKERAPSEGYLVSE